MVHDMRSAFKSVGELRAMQGVEFGLLAFLANFIVLLITHKTSIPLGNLFLFLASMSLGLSGTLGALITGLAPFFLFLPDSSVDQVRAGIICFIILLISKRFPRFPISILGIFVWLCVLAPIYYVMLSKHALPVDVSSQTIFLTAFTEILLLLLSEIVLSHPSLSNLVGLQPTQRQMSFVLSSAASLLAGIPMYVVILIDNSGFFGRVPNAHSDPHLSWLFVACTLALAGSYIVGQAFGIFLDKLEYSRSAGLLNVQHAFSGLSSEFWRRQRDEEVRQNTEAISSQIEILAKNKSPGNIEAPSKTFSSDVGVCALDRNGTITFVNRTFRVFTNIQINSVIGRKIDSVGMDVAIVKHIIDLLEKTFTKGPRATELKVNQLPDKLCFFEISSIKSDVFADSSLSGGPDSVIITMRDITDRRTIEGHILKAQKLESLGIMVKGIAGALNNSLSSITREVSAAQSCVDPKSLTESLTKIFDEAKRSSSVTQQLLEFADDRPTGMSPRPLGQFIDERMELLQKSVGENCPISFSKSDDQIPVVCDPALLTQALSNLILNCKESYADGTGPTDITLDTEEIDETMAELHSGTKPGRFIRLRVKDNGFGMTPEILSNAFDPLFTTKSGSGHAGLGLSAVFAIVRAHDGFLTAESHPDKGTVVSIYLPIYSPSVLTTKEVPIENETTVVGDDISPIGNGQHILMIEESQPMSRVIASMLGSINYKVVCVQTQDEFNKAVANGRFSLIVVDLDTAQFSEHQLFTALSALGTKVLLLGSSSPSSEMAIPDVQFIRKPFDMEMLATAIYYLLTK